MKFKEKRTTSSVAIICWFLHFLKASGYPHGAGHCDGGIPDAFQITHGDNGFGTIEPNYSNFPLNLYFDNGPALENMQSYSLPVKVNHTLTLSGEEGGTIFKGFLFRLSEKNKNELKTRIYLNKNSQALGVFSTFCSDDIIGITHNSASDKTSVSLDVYAEEEVNLILEVTVVLYNIPMRGNAWLYSRYDLSFVKDPPFGECRDSSLPIIDFVDSTSLKRCKLVLNTNETNSYCSMKEVASHCPLSCDETEHSCSKYRCTDSNNMFEIKGKNGKKKLKKCSSLFRNKMGQSVNGRRLDKLCAKKGIRSTCRSTCGYCKSCEDDSNFYFLDGNGQNRTCSWLTKRNEWRRRNKYCAQGEIKGHCLASCVSCKCEDNNNFTFHAAEESDLRSCSWLNSGDPETKETRREKFCYDQNGSNGVGANCIKSCGFCS